VTPAANVTSRKTLSRRLHRPLVAASLDMLSSGARKHLKAWGTYYERIELLVYTTAGDLKPEIRPVRPAIKKASIFTTPFFHILDRITASSTQPTSFFCLHDEIATFTAPLFLHARQNHN
ncbi:unnamed protein product, partial [Laminaria digitata]